MSRILVVDDNEQNLYLVRFILERQGHTIDEARNGQQAVDMSAADDYDLIIMDIQMPVMDGLEATRLIKQRNGQQKVVALTAKAMSGDRESILAQGCDGYIDKPIDTNAFPDLIARFL